MASDTRDTTPTATSSSSVIKERRCRIEWLYPVSVRSVSSGTRTCPLVERPARSSVTRVSWTPSNFMTEKISLKKKRKLSDVWNINISSDYVVLDINSCLAFNIHIYPFFPFTIHCENKNTCKCNFFIILSNMKQTPNFIGGLQKKGLMSIKNFFLWTCVQ